MEDTPEPEKATTKQRQYIAWLVDDLCWTSEEIAKYAEKKGIDLVDMTKDQASQVITELKAFASR